MQDQHPENFEIEIDREALTQYHRACWHIYSVILLGILSLVTAMMLNVNVEDLIQVDGALMQTAAFVALVGLCFACSMSLSLIYYFLRGRRSAERNAHALRVTVEGPFLRIRDGSRFSSDRKLHFRAIIDYTVKDDAMMNRYGLKSLILTTASGSQQPLTITGIKDCERIRDLLAEIDAMRELA